MSTDSELAKSLHFLLSASPNAPELNEVLALLDARVHEISSAEDVPKAQQDFEEELQVIFDKEVDHSHIQQLEIFLSTLFKCRTIIPSVSIISTWFDLLLRPALREPRLSSASVEHAKHLILQALKGENSDKVASFRRRLLDLFLLDVLNESSGKDIFEWAELDEAQRERNSLWKNNLEDVLVRYGLQEPEEFMTVMNVCFRSPSSRLQILTLLDSFISHHSFVDISSSIISHPLLSSLLRSLEVDNSSTVCAVELACLIKLLPVAATRSFQVLVGSLPRLLGILGRVLCWKSRNGRTQQINKVAYSDLLDYNDDSLLAQAEEIEEQDILEIVENKQLKLSVREDLGWERLERTFDMSTSSLPVPRQFFAILYYLFPCNLIHFLRRPIKYLNENNVESPFTVGWEDALDDLEIRTAGSQLTRSFVMHPSVLVHDVQTELADSERWASIDVSHIIGESMLLDVGITSRVFRADSSPEQTSITPRYNTLHRSHDGYTTTLQTPTIRTSDLAMAVPRQRKVSLRDIIATSIALKSGADISVADNAPCWPSILFTPPPASPLLRVSSSPNLYEAGPSSLPIPNEVKLPTQISETISGLQREVLLLRTELNFELWLKRENIRHIGRLRKEDIVTKGAEAEQQRLQNMLREYRAELLELRTELQKERAQAEGMKQKSIEWSTALSGKLKDLREQKKRWQADANSLKNDNLELKSQLTAQSKLLSEATNRMFDLETAIKKDSHKVDRLRDYEKRIEQLTAMHRMWNKDIVQYNEQSKEMSQLISEYQKMKLKVEAYEKSQEELESKASADRRRIQTLEASLRSVRMSAESNRLQPSDIVAAHASDRSALISANEKLRAENAELRDEIDEVKAMVEILRGTQGLISPTLPANHLSS